MSKRSMSSKDIKHPMVRGYLQKNYPGRLIYINSGNSNSEKYGMKEVVHCLRKQGWPDETIAKRLRMYPSQLVRVAGSKK